MKRLYRTLFAAAALASAVPAAALAQANQNAFAVTYIDVAPSAGAVMSLLKEVAAASRKEAGNLRYEVLAEMDRPNAFAVLRFAILEAWSDTKAFEAHGGAAALTRFRAALKPLLIGPYDERPSLGLTLGPVRAAGSPGAVYVLTHVDVAGGQKDQAVAMLEKLAQDSRKEGGCERFEAWQQGNRANHFTVNEVFKDQAAYQAHILAAGTREFREKIGPLLGALYDDRIYKTIE
jgi:quinol monooxygenase YgiN